MIAFIHLPMVRYVVPGGGAHAEEEAAASVAGGLLILAKNEGDGINSKIRKHERSVRPSRNCPDEILAADFLSPRARRRARHSATAFNNNLETIHVKR